MELLNFQVEISTLKGLNSTIHYSSPLLGKTSESHNSPTTEINLPLIGKIGS
jgi:hypothetical protein